MRRALKPILFSGPPGWVRAAYPDVWRSLALAAHFDQGLYWAQGLGQCSPTALIASSGPAKWVTNSAGLLVPIAAGVLPIGAGVGLLPEDARTNLFLQSDNQSNAAWFTAGANPTVVSSNNVAPDGTATATRLTLGNGSAAAIRQLVAVTNNQPVVISVYVKLAPSNAATNFRIATNNNGAWNTGGDAVIALTSSWQRITLTYQNTTATSIAVYFGAQKQDITEDATCKGDVLIWGADFNANNTVPLSHISTTTATVTRSADALTLTGTALSLASQPALGVFAQTLGLAATGNNAVILGQNGVDRAFLYVDHVSGSNALGSYDGTNLLTTGNSAAVTSATVPVKGAAAIAAAARTLALSGGTVASQSNLFAATTSVTVGNNGGLTRALNGSLQKLAIISGAPSDAQIQALGR